MIYAQPPAIVQSYTQGTFALTVGISDSTAGMEAYPSSGVTITRRPHLGERERVRQFGSRKGGKRR